MIKLFFRYLISIPVFVLALIELLHQTGGVMGGAIGGVNEAIAPLVAMGIASAAIKGVTGLTQMIKRKPEEVEYDIPLEVYQALDIARTNANGEDPRFRTMRENLESQTAAMARRATEMGGGAIGALSSLQANQMAGTRDIDMMEENYQLEQERVYREELRNMAGFKDQEFDINTLQPNERLWNQYYNSRNAGMQNLMGSMDSIVSLAAGDGFGDNEDGSEESAKKKAEKLKNRANKKAIRQKNRGVTANIDNIFGLDGNEDVFDFETDYSFSDPLDNGSSFLT